MQFRKMGNTIPWDVSALGFGCMRFPSKLQRPDVKESIRILRASIDAGINYIDTAWMYHMGMSETIVGTALQDGYREKVHLVTKLPIILVRKEDDFDNYLTKQLAKLQTDHLDMYLFHQLNTGQFAKMQQLHLIEKMEKARDEGKINYIGFSFHDTLPVFKQIVDFYNWDAVQIQYNYVDTGIQAGYEGLKYAAEKGLGVIVMEPLRGGELAKPSPEAVEVMKNAQSKRTPVDWALQYLWNLPEVSVVLSGMGSMKMVEENCASADRSGINSLSAEDQATVDQLVAIYRKRILVPCTACQYCMPCPSGVNIPQNFAIVNNVSMGDVGGISSRVKQWVIKRGYKRLVSSRKAVKAHPGTGNASLCTRCGTCLPKCPQSIQIPDQLEKVQLVMGKGRKIRDVFT